MTDQPEPGPGQDGVGRKVTHPAAARILAERDPVIVRLVEQAGPPRLSRPAESHFATLIRAIVYQQLAGCAAAAIHGRLIAALGGDVIPEKLIALSDETMRAVGLSRNKMASLRDLAAKVLAGTVVLCPPGLADLGVRRGYGLAGQVPTPTARELRPLGDPFKPYRSVGPGTAGGPRNCTPARPTAR